LYNIQYTFKDSHCHGFSNVDPIRDPDTLWLAYFHSINDSITVAFVFSHGYLHADPNHHCIFNDFFHTNGNPVAHTYNVHVTIHHNIPHKFTHRIPNYHIHIHEIYDTVYFPIMFRDTNPYVFFHIYAVINMHFVSHTHTHKYINGKCDFYPVGVPNDFANVQSLTFSDNVTNGLSNVHFHVYVIEHSYTDTESHSVGHNYSYTNNHIDVHTHLFTYVFSIAQPHTQCHGKCFAIEFPYSEPLGNGHTDIHDISDANSYRINNIDSLEYQINVTFIFTYSIGYAVPHSQRVINAYTNVNADIHNKPNGVINGHSI
jgi:hypothetical protein